MPGYGSGAVVFPWSSPRWQHHAAVARKVHLTNLSSFSEPPLSIVAEGTVRNARMRVLFRAIDANLGASPNVALETLCPYRLPVSSAQIERVRRHDVLLENDGP